MNLAYCSVPSRLAERSEEIMDFVEAGGQAPFSPFLAFPLERFEAGPVGREKTMEFCRRAVAFCDTFQLFGISRGTILYELEYAFWLKKPVDFHFQEFDPLWQEALAELKKGILGHNQTLLRYLERRIK